MNNSTANVVKTLIVVPIVVIVVIVAIVSPPLVVVAVFSVETVVVGAEDIFRQERLACNRLHRTCRGF